MREIFKHLTMTTWRCYFKPGNNEEMFIQLYFSNQLLKFRTYWSTYYKRTKNNNIPAITSKIRYNSQFSMKSKVAFNVINDFDFLFHQWISQSILLKLENKLIILCAKHSFSSLCFWFLVSTVCRIYLTFH